MSSTQTPTTPPTSGRTGAAHFATRHLGPDASEVATMLTVLGYESVEALLDEVVPGSIRDSAQLNLHECIPGAGTGDEARVLTRLAEIADRNTVATSLIGCGWYANITPNVILRNLVENPAWYTAYTPYQPEISQGRLEMLLNFQTLVADLCGMDIANASMLDEATAAAEAMTLARRVSKAKGNVFLVDQDCHPQVIDVVASRAAPLGIDVELFDPARSPLPLPHGTFGILVAYPGSSGVIRDHRDLVAAAHDAEAIACVTSDLLALTLLEAPGMWGADVVVGSAQRFGVPMGYGGPHAGFMAVAESAKRALPGRLVGVSVDSAGNPAYRLALQTREQHIRREKATSNICTAQVLLANVAAAYAVYHGPGGLTAIATGVHEQATFLRESLAAAGIEVLGESWFDTFTVHVEGGARETVAAAAGGGVNLRLIDEDHVGISCDETTDLTVCLAVCEAFGVAAGPGSGTGHGDVSPIPDHLVGELPS